MSSPIEPAVREEIRRIVREETLGREEVAQAVEEGTLRVLKTLGIDHDNALSTQQDMAYLRRLRAGSHALSSKITWGIVSAIGTAIITLIVIGINTLRGTNG